MKGIRTTISTAACLVGLALILTPPPAAADNVINDDCIIIGSQCIGFDCVNGESFGFDTLRLKENNLRIHFLDTSNTSSFPTNDWRIVANDSSNGGSEYLGIEDSSAGRFPFRVFAGARANALVVDAQSDIGIGTSNPVADVHIKTGNTPTLRLEQDGTSGFAPHTWDVAGNETNFFIRNATDGSTLPLRIRPDTPTSSIDIFSDKIQVGQDAQDIGIGTSSPGQAVHLKRNTTGNVAVRIENNNADWDLRSNTVGDFAVTAAGSGVNELALTETTGNLTIVGTITTGGVTCGGGCDLVFSPEFEVESIDEHAASMWSNQHLPAIGPTPENQPFDLTEKTGRMLNELEKAHIYIEQLHKRLEKLEKAAAEPAEQK